ncbi:MAG: glycosyltransferase [Alphaproteobacteria bacterium]
MPAPPDFTLRLIDRIPADAAVVVHAGLDRSALEAYARVNPAAGIVTWEDARTAAPGSVDAVVFNLPIGVPERAAGAIARAAAMLRPGGILLYRCRNAEFHEVLAGRLGGRVPPQSTYLPESAAGLAATAGLSVGAAIADEEDHEGAAAFIARHEDALEALGVSARSRKLRLAGRSFLIQAVQGAMPPALNIHARLRNPGVGANAAMSEVRVERPLRMVAAMPKVNIRLDRDPAPLNPPERPRSIFIHQRPILRRPWGLDLLRQLNARNFVTVMEFDDHPSYWPDIAAHGYLTFAGPHAVQTSTDALAEELRRHNPNVVVFRNDIAELPPPRRYQPGPVRLFYGSLNRAEAMRPLTDAMNRVLRSTKVPTATAVLLDREFHDRLETRHKSYSEMVDQARHRTLVGQADIVLLPLDDTVFNRCKSDLSFIEAAARGAVVLASPVVYGATVVDGETGMLFRTPEEFAAKLRLLIEDGELRRKIAGAAYAYVRDHRLMKDQFRRRYEWYLSLLDRKAELDAGVRERLPDFDAAP